MQLTNLCELCILLLGKIVDPTIKYLNNLCSTLVLLGCIHTNTLCQLRKQRMDQLLRTGIKMAAMHSQYRQRRSTSGS
jgi:hypothetical protein